MLIIFSWIFTLFVSYNKSKQLLFLTFYYNNKIYLDKNFYFITTNITDLLSSYLKISYFLTNQLLSIYILYNVVIFLAPGLYNLEYNKIKSKLKIVSFIMYFCFLFTNRALLPTFWNFFNSYILVNKNVPIYFEAKITEYIHLYIFIYYTIMFICIIYLLFYYAINLFKHNYVFFRKSKKINNFNLFYCVNCNYAS